MQLLESNLHDQKRTRGDSQTTEYLHIYIQTYIHTHTGHTFFAKAKARQASIYTMKKERNEDRQTIYKLQC